MKLKNEIKPFPTSPIATSPAQRLYRAEQSLKIIYTDNYYTDGQYLGSKATQNLVDVLVGKGRVGIVGGGRWESAKAYHGDAGEPLLRLPNWDRSEYTIIHEATHWINTFSGREESEDAHGKNFASILLLLVREMLGEKDYKHLLKKYIKYDVEYDVLTESNIEDIRKTAYPWLNDSQMGTACDGSTGYEVNPSS